MIYALIQALIRALGSGQRHKVYNPSTLVAPVDLKAAGGLNRYPRWISVAADDGTIAVVDPSGEDETLPSMPRGFSHVGEFRTLRVGSTCTSVVVVW